MTLKQKKISSESQPFKEPDPSSGPWGRINLGSNTSEVVRFCHVENRRIRKTHSYPYRALSSWHWTVNEDKEELLINAGGDAITVKGKALVRIVELRRRRSDLYIINSN